MAKQRIEYIDAMRGFTMILVVYSHVCHFCLGDRWMGWNDVFFLFRLPCFFFISGWLFEPHRGTVPCVSSSADYTGTVPSVMSVIKHKFMVQIVPTVIFLLLLAPPPLFFSKLGATKGGYWFTFALFEFFLLYLFSERYLIRWGGAFALIISIAAFCYDIYYNRYFKDMGLMTQALGFLSFITWRYYLFFFIGTRVKRYYETFVEWTNKRWVMLLVVFGFVTIAWLSPSDQGVMAYLFFAVGGILGMTMIFTIFRYIYTTLYFLPLTSYLSPLKYIGTRTLDIYLLHYFLLPRFLLKYSETLQTYDSQWLDFIVAMTISMLVVAGCLLVSYVIRLNPFLGHHLFGVKYEQKQ